MNRKRQIDLANPFNGATDISLGKMIGFMFGAEWADEHPVSPWISVEERLPEPHTNILFIVRYIDHVAYYTGFFHSPVQWESENRTFFSNLPLYNITHWMNIPSIDKGVECDENELDGED